ncbi:hypothetical protein PBY51_021865 [Eleginops maclovinus]|uniref:Uncharacterized protein n=1 Tax=Eleginops maclovinus TaxID=56733 RepID=A0AAN8ALB2_ELEMC|nr:hypothetical protein PBY51_021865 [Eleginops maclovinus]
MRGKVKRKTEVEESQRHSSSSLIQREGRDPGGGEMERGSMQAGKQKKKEKKRKSNCWHQRTETDQQNSRKRTQKGKRNKQKDE